MLLSIQITLTRDSVCMGDDIEDHKKIIDIVPQNNTCKTILDIAVKYLPKVMGYGHTWDCYVDETKIAILIGNCTGITSVADFPCFTNGCKIYFKYHSATY